MRKVLMLSGLALAMAGCVAQQGQAPQVQVRDLSMSREQTTSSHYTVEAGDTLYGVAWRHDMDYRDLARLNRISPPYQIQPGQQLVLSPNAAAPASTAPGSEGEEQTLAVAGGTGVVATPLGGQAAAAESGDLEWLLPDGSTETTSSAPSQEALAGAAQVAEGPGPVYDYDSPGADGFADEENQPVERPETAATKEANQEVAEEVNQDVAEEANQEVAEEVNQDVAEEASQEVVASEPATEPDTGTAVAGSSPAAESNGRTYTPVEEVAWQWPVNGEIVGQFGDGGTITAGIDIAGQKGQPVKAAGPGIVVYAGSGVRGYGNLILLKHNDQFLSAYAHNDSLRVRENDVVQAGEVIAIMGDSDAENVRLHFEVRKDGQPQDPLEYLPSR